jgi:hypothetical protein
MSKIAPLQPKWKKRFIDCNQNGILTIFYATKLPKTALLAAGKPILYLAVVSATYFLQWLFLNLLVPAFLEG